MIVKNLNDYPTLQYVYNRLSAVPVVVQMRPASSSFCGYWMSSHFDENSGLDEKPNGLVAFQDGNFITSSLIGNDEASKEAPFLWTTFQGDNQFAIKTVREVEDDIVRITTSLNSGYGDDKNRLASEIDAESNETKVSQVFQILGGEVDTKTLKNEILCSGFDKAGQAIPTFPDTNRFVAGLQRLYTTSDFTKKAGQVPDGVSVSDFGSVGAFWDSWGDGIKTALTAAGGLAGGIVGSAAGPAGTLGGAAGGAGIGAAVGDALLPNNWF
jgi:hypothetical protein